MKNVARLVILSLFTVVACTPPESKVDNLEVAKRYYEALDNADITAMGSLLTDSLVTKETEYNYVQTFTKQQYIEWLKWDAVFEPTYEVLEINKENEAIKARISKTDKRIEFLHSEPIITDQILRIEQGKIISVETVKYVEFNDSLFVANRTLLLNWVSENHPDLGAFINDQTEAGGRRYLKALELFEAAQ